jgi:hypothetical protein
MATLELHCGLALLQVSAPLESLGRPSGSKGRMIIYNQHTNFVHTPPAPLIHFPS